MFSYRLTGTPESLDHLTPALWDAGCQGLEEREDALIAYFESPVELPFAGEWLEADSTDWVAMYRASLKPIQVGRVVINPGWDLSPVDGDDSLVVDLEPGLAFGTGQHETTRLAIRALQHPDVPYRNRQQMALDPVRFLPPSAPLAGARVLDVGAGSGILGIVAAKLGADVLGVDNDAQTVPVAQENAARNHVKAEFVHGVLEDVLQRGPFDLVLANLFAELHDALMGQYRQVLEPGGSLLMTGILAGTEQADEGEQMTWDSSSGRETLVMAALEREGLRFVRREQEGEWVLIEALKQ